MCRQCEMEKKKTEEKTRRRKRQPSHWQPVIIIIIISHSASELAIQQKVQMLTLTQLKPKKTKRKKWKRCECDDDDDDDEESKRYVIVNAILKAGNSFVSLSPLLGESLSLFGCFFMLFKIVSNLFTTKPKSVCQTMSCGYFANSLLVSTSLRRECFVFFFISFISCAKRIKEKKCSNENWP